MSFIIKSPADTQDELRARFRKLRVKRDLTQEGLAKRSGVSLPSVRRFERTGLIAFDSLLKIALVLECLDDFDKVAAEDERALIGRPLDAVLSETRGRRKGRIT